MRRSLGCLGLTLLLLAGCGAGMSRSAPAVRVVDEQQFAEVLARHKGKVVLVDFWATWCPPCVALLPHTAELGRRLAERGLVVLPVSFDDPDALAAVERVLQTKGVVGESYLSRYGGGTQSAEAFRLENGALPLLRIYDRNGSLRHTFGGGEPFEPDEIDRSLEKLL